MNFQSLDPLKNQLENHPIFTCINSIEELQIFMEHHVYPVWDFMSLLKKLQFDLVPHGSPWLPNPNGNLVRFLNEIVMEEESDQAYGDDGSTRFASHFEIYLSAMEEIGASTKGIKRFLSIIKSEGLKPALEWSDLPEPSKKFMKQTFRLIEFGKPHQIAASFAIARESVVPLMFQRILDLSDFDRSDAPVFQYYLERHTELDGDHHGPMSQSLLENMCEKNPALEKEVLQQASCSIRERIEFWDGVLEAMPSKAIVAS
jgi:hypothetical protein